MKKITVILICLTCCLAGFAQKAKFGHVDYADIMKVMPGIDTAQAALLTYQQELQEVAQRMVNEFKQKEAAYAQLQNSGASSAILKVREDEMMKLYKRIQDFAASSEADLQAKQVALLQPFQEKLLDAIKKVASNGNYTYVFDISTLAFYAESDNLTSAVKTYLGVK